MDIQFKRSSVAEKQPTSDQLDYGEIAINFNSTHPFLSLKDNEDEIRTISDDEHNAQTYQTISGMSEYAKSDDSAFEYSMTSGGTYNVWLKAPAESANTVSDTQGGQVVIGTNNSTKYKSVVIGDDNVCLTRKSEIIGNGNILGGEGASFGYNSIVIGLNNSGHTGRAIIIGRDNETVQEISSGDNQVLIGKGNKTYNHSPITLIGQYLNDVYTTGDTAWTDPIIILGEYNETYDDYPTKPDGERSTEHTGVFTVAWGSEASGGYNLFKVGGILYSDNYANNYQGVWCRENLKVEGGNLIVGDTCITEEQLKKLLALI